MVAEHRISQEEQNVKANIEYVKSVNNIPTDAALARELGINKTTWESFVRNPLSKSKAGAKLCSRVGATDWQLKNENFEDIGIGAFVSSGNSAISIVSGHNHSDIDLEILEKEMANFIESNGIFNHDEPAHKYFKALKNSKFDDSISFEQRLINFEKATADDYNGMSKLQITNFLGECSEHPEESRRTLRKIVSQLTDPDFGIALSKLQSIAIAMYESSFKTESDRLFEEAMHRKNEIKT